MIHRNLLSVAGVLAIACAGTACAYAKSPAPGKPRLFAPGVISGPANDSAVTFSPNGKTIYFLRDNSSNYVIMTSHFNGNRWSKPKIASFSGRWRDFEPAMAPDGSYLIFASSRPVDKHKKLSRGHGGGNIHLWRVNRNDGGWGKPVVLPKSINRFKTLFSPAVAADGSVYFTAVTNHHGKFRIYRSRFKDGRYQPAQALPFSTGQWKDLYPTVAPDQSLIVFVSNRPPASAKHPTLFIAFRQEGHWGKPVSLGVRLGQFDPIEPRLGPNGHTLYFASSHVVPATYPRSEASAASALRRMENWNDWNDNLWKIDLTPWLKCRGHPGCSSPSSPNQPHSGARRGRS